MSAFAENNAGTWQDCMVAIRERLAGEKDDVITKADTLFMENSREFPLETDWFSQDITRFELGPLRFPHNFIEYIKPDRDNSFEQKLISAAIRSCEPACGRFSKDLAALKEENVPAGDKRWLDLFAEVCKARRNERLRKLSGETPKIAFVKRRAVRPSFYAYTEGQSDAQAERHFHPGGKLCLLSITPAGCSVENLISDTNGVIRDLDVSYDGKRLLFAWKKSDREDDYHLYEMDCKSRAVRQLTFGLGVADYEGVYLPSDEIMFSSSRCVQTVDCWWTEVSNMYKCDKDGKYLIRLGFDQVHTINPAVLNNGSVVYTRWDYNDRGQVFPQPLFQMNPDGTGQTEYYGNNSYFPTVINHACPIPGSDRIVAVLHGHHTWQGGPLAIIDRTKGTQEASGVQLIAPVRETKAARIDTYGQNEEMFRHPYALSETEFIVGLVPPWDSKLPGREGKSEFALYWVHADGNRELLEYEPEISCNNPRPLASRNRPPVKPSMVDYTKDSGTYFMQDIYVGPGLAGIERGTIRELRVVALKFRAAGAGHNTNRGEAGGALVSTPVSIGNGSWDVKKILGSATVYEDGSAMFRVPANTPVYFQALNNAGNVVQTMRSWSTLMPGEVFGCVGCHEDKLTTPLVNKRTMAVEKGVQDLKPFYGPARGFSFTKEIQPILDKNCITCHDGQKPKNENEKKAFSLKSDSVRDTTAKRFWKESYLALTGSVPPRDGQVKDAFTGNPDRDIVNWVSVQSAPPMLSPCHRGSIKSKMIEMLRNQHGKIKLTDEEMRKICAWIDLGVPFCGDYLECRDWSPGEVEKYIRYQRKRERLEAEIRRNVEELIKKETGQDFKISDPLPLYEDVQ